MLPRVSLVSICGQLLLYQLPGFIIQNGSMLTFIKMSLVRDLADVERVLQKGIRDSHNND